jgi:hypothetical protein
MSVALLDSELFLVCEERRKKTVSRQRDAEAINIRSRGSEVKWIRKVKVRLIDVTRWVVMKNVS